MPNELELVLHVWPGRWDLPTFTPACLASILYLQLTMPGKFVVEECTNPDASPDGQLPYLTHGIACITSFTSIVKYVEGLHRRPTTSEEDEDMEREREDGTANFSPPETRLRHAQETAWIAFVSAQLGDLVACSFFTLRHNYYDFVRHELAELFPVPQRYYVPDRLRGTHKPRLEASGLWSVSAEEAEEEKRKKRGLTGLADNTAIQEAFGKAKVLEKARMTLDLIARLLGNKKYFLDSPEPTALDVLVAAHILLLIDPPFPNDLIRTLITESYSSLVAHARKLQGRTLSPGGSHAMEASLSSSYEVVEAQTQPAQEYTPLTIRPEPQASLSQVISSLTVPFSFRKAFHLHKGKSKSKADKEFDQMRWAWYGLVALGVVGWIWSVGSRIMIVRVEDLEGLEPEGIEKVGSEKEADEEIDEEGGYEEEEEHEEEDV